MMSEVNTDLFLYIMFQTVATYNLISMFSIIWNYSITSIALI